MPELNSGAIDKVTDARVNMSYRERGQRRGKPPIPEPKPEECASNKPFTQKIQINLIFSRKVLCIPNICSTFVPYFAGICPYAYVVRTYL